MLYTVSLLLNTRTMREIRLTGVGEAARCCILRLSNEIGVCEVYAITHWEMMNNNTYVEVLTFRAV